MHKLDIHQMAACLAKDLPDHSNIITTAELLPVLQARLDPARNIRLLSADQVSGNEQAFDISIVQAERLSAGGDLQLVSASEPHKADLLSAQYTLVLADFFDSGGSARLQADCPAAVDKTACVDAFYSDIAFFDFSKGNVFVRELIEGITLNSLQMETDALLNIAPELRLIKVPAAAAGSALE